MDSRRNRVLARKRSTLALRPHRRSSQRIHWSNFQGWNPSMALGWCWTIPQPRSPKHPSPKSPPPQLNQRKNRSHFGGLNPMFSRHRIRQNCHLDGRITWLCGCKAWTCCRRLSGIHDGQNCVAEHLFVVHRGSYRKQWAVLVGSPAIWPTQTSVGKVPGQSQKASPSRWHGANGARDHSRHPSLYEKLSHVSAGRDWLHCCQWRAQSRSTAECRLGFEQ